MTDCVIYTRVSSKEQEDGFSLVAQRDLLRAYAGDKGFRIAQEYVEVDSARAPGRPKFELMLDYLKANPDTVVLVEKTDRLVRNLKDYITLDDLKVNIHFVKEGAAFGPGAKSSDRFMQGIKVLVATQYSENLSEEILKGMTKRAEAGKWSCKAPYGYRSNPETDSLEIVPAEAEAVRWLFRTYATGEYSLRELCARFRRRAFPWRNARPIYPTLAHKMLNNLIYMGIVKWGDVVAEGEHDPIVDPALWGVGPESHSSEIQTQDQQTRVRLPWPDPMRSLRVSHDRLDQQGASLLQVQQRTWEVYWKQVCQGGQADRDIHRSPGENHASRNRSPTDRLSNQGFQAR